MRRRNRGTRMGVGLMALMLGATLLPAAAAAVPTAGAGQNESAEHVQSAGGDPEDMQSPVLIRISPEAGECSAASCLSKWVISLENTDDEDQAAAIALIASDLLTDLNVDSAGSDFRLRGAWEAAGTAVSANAAVTIPAATTLNLTVTGRSELGVAGQVVGLQGWIQTADAVSPTFAEDLPLWDAANPDASGPWIGDGSCIKDLDFEPGWCSQAFSSLPPLSLVEGQSGDSNTTISGTVWFSEAFDGLRRSSTDTPLQGVTASLLLADSTEPVAETETDPDGKYVFDGIERAGKYRVTFDVESATKADGTTPVSPEEFLVPTQATEECAIAPAAGTNCVDETWTSETYFVAEGEQVEGIDLGVTRATVSAKLTKGAENPDPPYNYIEGFWYDAPEYTEVSIVSVFTNTGTEALNSVNFYDRTPYGKGETAKWTKCYQAEAGWEYTFTEQDYHPPYQLPSGEIHIAYWDATLPDNYWIPAGQEMVCLADLRGISPASEHQNNVTVTAYGAQSRTQVQRSADFLMNSAVDDYRIDVEKGIEVDSGDDYAILPELDDAEPGQTYDVVVRWINRGKYPVMNMTFADTTEIGPAVQWNLCFLAEDTITFAPGWQNKLKQEVIDTGESISCVGTLPAMDFGDVHRNTAVIKWISYSKDPTKPGEWDEVQEQATFTATVRDPRNAVAILAGFARGGQILTSTVVAPDRETPVTVRLTNNSEQDLVDPQVTPSTLSGFSGTLDKLKCAFATDGGQAVFKKNTTVECTATLSGLAPGAVFHGEIAFTGTGKIVSEAVNAKSEMFQATAAPQLPSLGGTSTAWFLISGFVLMGGGAVYELSRRMTKANGHAAKHRKQN